MSMTQNKMSSPQITTEVEWRTEGNCRQLVLPNNSKVTQSEKWYQLEK